MLWGSKFGSQIAAACMAGLSSEQIQLADLALTLFLHTMTAALIDAQQTRQHLVSRDDLRRVLIQMWHSFTGLMVIDLHNPTAMKKRYRVDLASRLVPVNLPWAVEICRDNLPAMRLKIQVLLGEAASGSCVFTKEKALDLLSYLRIEEWTQEQVNEIPAGVICSIIDVSPPRCLNQITSPGARQKLLRYAGQVNVRDLPSNCDFRGAAPSAVGVCSNFEDTLRAQLGRENVKMQGSVGDELRKQYDNLHPEFSTLIAKLRGTEPPTVATGA